MSYRIKHETFFFIFVCLISILLGFGLFFWYIFIDEVDKIPYGIIVVLSGIATVAAILYFVERIMGTKIVFKDNCMVIYYLFRIKKIPLSNIFNVNIEEYKRYRRKPYPHHDYRMRMVISVLKGSDIKLTDDASVFNGSLLLQKERRPKEEVALYQVYMQLMSGKIVKPVTAEY